MVIGVDEQIKVSITAVWSKYHKAYTPLQNKSIRFCDLFVLAVCLFAESQF